MCKADNRGKINTPGKEWVVSKSKYFWGIVKLERDFFFPRETSYLFPSDSQELMVLFHVAVNVPSVAAIAPACEQSRAKGLHHKGRAKI